VKRNNEDHTNTQLSISVLREYISARADGARISWGAVENATGIGMDGRGKRQFAQAAKQARRCYNKTLVRGAYVGVEFTSHETARGHLEGRINGIMRTARTASEASSMLVERHESDMTEPDKTWLLMRRSMLAAMSNEVRLAQEAPRPAIAIAPPKATRPRMIGDAS